MTGMVQGVGFRPFVYTLAARHGLAGWVRNDTAGVRIEVEGEAPRLDAFTSALRADAPPLSRIVGMAIEDGSPTAELGFAILTSAAADAWGALVPPDIATCEACLADVLDPLNRRYRYPFTNCTNCGPRFTIVKGLPYDRPKTTMVDFPMCPACRAEYDDPSDRRFHAQPNACPTCGPRLELAVPGDGAPSRYGDEALVAAARRLAAGCLVAIKGLGGYHLACLARDAAAVGRMRRAKHRPTKPFALMVRDLAAAETCVALSPAARERLTARERPIVVAPARQSAPVAPAVAPGLRELGVMLPYTPLHHLLLAALPEPAMLVMTSGNAAGEPLEHEDAAAERVLGPMVDALLRHDRAIHVRADDSVWRCAGGEEAFVRRSRGYAPAPLAMPTLAGGPVLAVGGHLKSAVAIAKDGLVFPSQHIGTLATLDAIRAFEGAITHLEALLNAAPRALAYDRHPGYHATRYAMQRAETDGLAAIPVQHHHAHVAAVMAEHALGGPVLGVAFDGTGLGDDGHLWGGEILLATTAAFTRVGHLLEVPLPGGEAAIREPWRMAAVWLRAALGDKAFARPIPFMADGFDPATWRVVAQMIERGLNAPPTSSAGRLFDAVSALVGGPARVDHEAQAAIALEQAATGPDDGAYAFDVARSARAALVLDPRPVIRAIVLDLEAGVERPKIAARFHGALARAAATACARLRDAGGPQTVVLCGGVFNNLRLRAETRRHLERSGFAVHAPIDVPAGDGGLAVGQAVVALAVLAARDRGAAIPAPPIALDLGRLPVAAMARTKE